MGTHDSKGEPVPYTSPDYNPDGSARPPADAPTKPAAAPPASGGAGEQSEQGKEPQTYVDPAYDPNKG